MTDRQTVTVRRLTYEKRGSEWWCWSDVQPMTRIEDYERAEYALLDALLSMQTERDEAVEDVRWLLKAYDGQPGPFRLRSKIVEQVRSRYPQEREETGSADL